jgi:Uma2 family endonuclease
MIQPNSSMSASTAKEPEPTWDIAHLFPPQGMWTENDYLALETNHLVEFSNGRLEVLPMPTTTHQMILTHLYGLLLAFSTAHDLGTVLVAALRVRLRPRVYREPDVVFMRKENAHRIGDDYWEGADLVMEVVSGDAKDRRRDLVEKRADYARARIPEYWIVDPCEERITVLRLSGKRYVVHGKFAKGTTATSALLPGFSVYVIESFFRPLPIASKAKAKRKPKRPPSA